MNDFRELLRKAVGLVLGIIVVSAVFSWAVENDPGGSFSMVFNPLGAVAAFVLDPTTILFLLAVSIVFYAFNSRGF